MEQQSSLKVKIQKLGTSLSNMVMPNIGAFIAWGVITALFIEDGYLPNEKLATVVGPMLTYLLPILIGYTGGYNVYAQRGGVVGAIATFGAIAGSTVPMFIGAMIMGPLGGWLIKKFDAKFQSKIPTGFEMLVNNFSAGLIGFGLVLIAFFAIGPNILPFIAKLIADGLKVRKEVGSTQAIDVLACENMIGGSQFLYEEVQKYLSGDELAYVEEYVGFPNAAVDRIVPAQSHEDPLFVVVEPFNEWVVETSRMKNPHLKLEGVHYEEDLEPFIERKLFSVNSGHATSAYTGAYYGAKTILEALQNADVKAQLEDVLAEIRSLLIAKWGFNESDLKAYHEVIIRRFENPYIVDDVVRVARTPIRKLGFDERFIRPIRELRDRGLSYSNLLKTVAYVFAYQDSNDEQSVQLQKLLAEKSLSDVVVEVTGLEDQGLVAEIVTSVEGLQK
ncbi:mannitol-1-phosphate 5-dehydrogenase [Streptococcus pluranimalium]|uniref:mannitol-1-phosphate 5-dehydrogenase n=1 Tax=Streptococcus pluranimalium TaxID=82348 RepID=UPI003F68D56E